MESYQDGRHPPMKQENREYANSDFPHMNSELNTFLQTARDSPLGSEKLHKLSEGVHTGQLQNYHSYYRGNYMNDQHGELISSNIEPNSQDTLISGFFQKNQQRQVYHNLHKHALQSNISCISSGIHMTAASYTTQRMIFNQSSTQSGPTPTLNQLLQTATSNPRLSGNYCDYFGGEAKSSEMSDGYSVSNRWTNNNRATSNYPQGFIQPPYSNQGGNVPEGRCSSSMTRVQDPSLGYTRQGEFMASMASGPQQYMMFHGRQDHTPHSNLPLGSMSYGSSASNQTISHHPSPQRHQMVYYHQQRLAQSSPQQSHAPSLSSSGALSHCHQSYGPVAVSTTAPDEMSNPVGSGNKKSEDIHDINRENAFGEDNCLEHVKTTTCNSSSHVGLPVAQSPVGSTVCGSERPASNCGAQVGSPHSPRAHSVQPDGQGHSINSGVPTQVCQGQHIMPPPMPGQMNYSGVSSGKIAGSSGGGVPHYGHFNPQYPQGPFSRPPNFVGMSSPGYLQAMYNGPGGQIGPTMYNMMNRGMPGYGLPFGLNSGSHIPNQHTGFSGQLESGECFGSEPGAGVSFASGTVLAMRGAMGGFGQQTMPQPSAHMLAGSKGAKAAAQAAMMAAANTASPRTPMHGLAASPLMLSPHGGRGSPNVPGMMLGSLVNPSLKGMSNQIQQITSSTVTLKSSDVADNLHCVNQTQQSAQSPNEDASKSASHAIKSISHVSPLSKCELPDASPLSNFWHTSVQSVDNTGSTSDITGLDGPSSMPITDSTSVDSGFHSSVDQCEKAPSDMNSTFVSSPSNTNLPSINGPCDSHSGLEMDFHTGKCWPDDNPTLLVGNPQSSTISGVQTGVTGVTQSIMTPVSSEMENGDTLIHGATQQIGNRSPVNIASISHAASAYFGRHSNSQAPLLGNQFDASNNMMGCPKQAGIHRCSMLAATMGSMPHYNMPFSGNAYASSYAGMAGNMHQTDMSNSLPPNTMISGMGRSSHLRFHNMPHCEMLNAPGPGGMHHGSMPCAVQNNVPMWDMPGMAPGCVVNNNLSPGSLPNHMASAPTPGGLTSSSNAAVWDFSGSSMMPNNFAVRANSVESELCQSEAPPIKRKKKTSDLSRLYDMGTEYDRRPFIDKMLAFLEEKGTPITAMPSISKQPLDLYRLYHCVREKGGMVEVNRGKKWKEICSFVNIGSSASAAFTLKKNYIRYLFAFECKFDQDGLDPNPILAEMEAQLEKKRESKKRVPSPGEKKDKRLPPDGLKLHEPYSHMPNNSSKMIEGGYPSSHSLPPPYMNSPKGQVVPGHVGGPGIIMHNSMLPQHPGMMGSQTGMLSHHQPPMIGAGGLGNNMANHGPCGMMIGPRHGPASQAMMPTTIPVQAGGMHFGGPMMGSNSTMVGPGCLQMCQENAYNPMGGMPCSMLGTVHKSDNTVFSEFGSNPSQMNLMSTPSPGTTSNITSMAGCNVAAAPSGTALLPPSSTPNSRPATADSVNVQDPFADEPSKTNLPSFAQRPPPGPTPSPGGFPSVANTNSGFTNRLSSGSNVCVQVPSGSSVDQGVMAFHRVGDNCQTPFSGPFLSRSEGSPFQSGHENQHLCQSLRLPSGTSEMMYGPRYPIHQSVFRPTGPGELYSGPHSFPNLGSTLEQSCAPSHNGYANYPSPQHPVGHPSINREGCYPGQGVPSSHYGEWSSVAHVPCASPNDPPHNADYGISGRDGGRWSPMPQHYNMPQVAPTTPPLGPFSRSNHRGSPQSREKVFQSKVQQAKTSTVVNSAPSLQARKDIVFPSSTVEAKEPNLVKRRRLTHKDLGPVDLWKVMMSLKSGLLAESTWAIDTLNILLFDDATVTYFNLGHLPGLLEVLTDHFRAAVSYIFHALQDHDPRTRCPCAHNGCSATGQDVKCVSDECVSHMLNQPPDLCVDKSLVTLSLIDIYRQGRTVKCDSGKSDSAVLDCKQWDCSANFVQGHWPTVGGDGAHHVVPCLESSDENRFLPGMFRPFNGSIDGHGSQPTVQRYDQPCIPRRRESVQRSMSTRNGFEGACLNCFNALSTDQSQNTVGADGVCASLCQSDGAGENTELTDDVKDQHGPFEPSSDDLRDSVMHDCPVSHGTGSVSLELSLDGEQASVDNVKLLVGDAANGKITLLENDETTARIVAMVSNEYGGDVEDESYRHDSPPLITVSAAQEEVGKRSVAISNIFRSLSFIPGNESYLSKHHDLMLLLGQLLLLHHRHPPCSKLKPANSDDVSLFNDVSKSEAGTNGGVDDGVKDWATSDEWWWDTLDALRENTLVVLANICSHAHMRDMDKEVCTPMLDGLLHWMVCLSSSACDPLPSSSSTSQLSPQRLVLEALCKLCIHDDNVDLLLATPPFSRVLLLMGRLTKLLSERTQPVPREFSIVLLSRLVQADPVAARALALQHPSVSLLIEFLESAEQNALSVSSQLGSSVPNSNPAEATGTSVDMLCRTASTLLHIARVPDNRKLLLQQENRLLTLVLSQILDPSITKIISDILFECSTCSPLLRT